VTVQTGNQPQNKDRPQPTGDCDMRLFVGNTPHSATEDEITEHFTTSKTTCVEVEIVRDHLTGHSRGFAFVEIDTDQTPAAVIENFNHSRMKGRVLTVNHANPKVSKEAHKVMAAESRREKQEFRR